METTSSVADIQMVTFLLGSEEYGVDVMDVREIVDITDVTRVANAPSHVEGVIDLRGSIVPIVSLKKRFGLPEAAAVDCNCIAVMDFAGALTGFLIDEVTDVIRVARRDILPPLELGSEPWMEGILSLGPRLIVVMNLKHLT